MANVKDWRIITKLPEIPNDCNNINKWILNQVEKSAFEDTDFDFYIDQINCLNRMDLNMEGSSRFKQKNIVKKLSSRFMIVTDNLWVSFQPDIVQMPYNLLDKRFLISGWMKKMNDVGVEIHVHSVFLQGLMMMNESDRPKKFNRGKIYGSFDE